MINPGKGKFYQVYDICHSYRPNSTWVSKQSLTVNGKRENITSDDFLVVGKQMNIKKTKQIISRITETVMNWNNYADEVNVDAKLRDAINKTLLQLYSGR